MLQQQQATGGKRRIDTIITQFGSNVEKRIKFRDVRRNEFTLLDVATNDNSQKRVFEAVREIVRYAMETKDWSDVRKLLQRNPLTTGTDGAEKEIFDSRDEFLAKEMERVFWSTTSEGTKFEAIYTLFYIAAFSEGEAPRTSTTRRMLRIFRKEEWEMRNRTFEYLNVLLCGNETGIAAFPELKRFVHENEAALSNPEMARKNAGISG